MHLGICFWLWLPPCLTAIVALLLVTEAKRVYVKTNPSTETKRSTELLGQIGRVHRAFPEVNGFVLEVPDQVPIENIRRHSELSFVDEIPTVSLGSRSIDAPNDPKLPEMWHISKLKMLEVWNLIPWDLSLLENVTVAICDTGYDFEHPDLDSSKVKWQWDYSEDDGDAQDDSTNGHGVHVAGTIAAVTNNSLGVVGISSGVSLMIGKMWGASEGGGYEKLMACMLDTANHGARIISLSVGGTMDWEPLKETMDYLYDKGVFVTACAGNDFERGNNPWYPAAYNTTFAVTNIDQNDDRFFASNTGDYIDIAAPGSDIWSTVRGGGYESWYGCSMATPVVSGLAALMISAKPDIKPRELMDLFTSTAVDLGEAGKDSTFGHGRIDPLAAARKLLKIADIPIEFGSHQVPVLNTPIKADASLISLGVKAPLSYFGTLLISLVPILLL